MSDFLGQSLDALDTPQLVIDLDVVDANVATLRSRLAGRPVDLRVHFKSLKCTGLARYLAAAGLNRFLCAKLSEAEVLADAGLTDVFLANQVVGPRKLRRLAELARRCRLRVCADDPDNVAALSAAAVEAGTTLHVLVEVDVGMQRCGVEPGEPALALARHVRSRPGLRFAGLQGYDGHLQLIPDADSRRAQSLDALRQLLATKQLLEDAGFPVEVVTGAGTGTWDFVANAPGVTEIQPGSFLLMDAAYRAIRPEFGCALSVLTSVVSRRPGWYVLDAGSKAISRDFGTPLIKDRPGHRVDRLSEEHTRVLADDPGVRVGDRFEVLPTHCCATMNLHRACVAVRQARIAALWPIEASGRYD